MSFFLQWHLEHAFGRYSDEHSGTREFLGSQLQLAYMLFRVKLEPKYAESWIPSDLFCSKSRFPVSSRFPDSRCSKTHVSILDTRDAGEIVSKVDLADKNKISSSHVEIFINETIFRWLTPTSKCFRICRYPYIAPMEAEAELLRVRSVQIGCVAILVENNVVE